MRQLQQNSGIYLNNIDSTLFVILSCSKNLDTRADSILNTWAKHLNKVILSDSPKKMDEFIIGYNTSQSYQGIQDKYINFFKNFDFTRAKYFFFVDDDTFVNIRNFKKLKLPKENKYFCICRRLYLSESGLDLNGRDTGYPLQSITGKDSFLPLSHPSGGSGFILSQSSCFAIQSYLRDESLEDTIKSAHGDVSIGFWARKNKIKLIHCDRLWWSKPEVLRTDNFSKFTERSEQRAVTFHYLSPNEMYLFHKKLNI